MNRGIRSGTSARPTSERAPRSVLLGQLNDVLALWALLALGRVELDLRPLGERLVAVAADGAVMNKEILARLVRGDESVPLRVVEPLHCSCRHEKTPPLPTHER